jgi:hypothetical protein
MRTYADGARRMLSERKVSPLRNSRDVLAHPLRRLRLCHSIWCRHRFIGLIDEIKKNQPSLEYLKSLDVVFRVPGLLFCWVCVAHLRGHSVAPIHTHTHTHTHTHHHTTHAHTRTHTRTHAHTHTRMHTHTHTHTHTRPCHHVHPQMLVSRPVYTAYA